MHNLILNSEIPNLSGSTVCRGSGGRGEGMVSHVQPSSCACTNEALLIRLSLAQPGSQQTADWEQSETQGLGTSS